jgi:NADH dehydrogenase [ubiquinone] 1 alpha subcomplex assembly factor 5
MTSTRPATCPLLPALLFFFVVLILARALARGRQHGQATAFFVCPPALILLNTTPNTTTQGALSQVRASLRPDGLFLGALFGGESLRELRRACALAQLEREGGVAPVVSPLAKVRDGGNVLTRAGLALPTVDVDAFELRYPDARRLAAHVRSMGEGAAPAAVATNRRSLRRDAALAAAAVHAYLTAAEGEGGSEGRGGGGGGGGAGPSSPSAPPAAPPTAEVSATFEVMFLTGWSPSRSQPKAAKRGSATISFEEFARHVEEQEKQQQQQEGGDGGAGGGPSAASAS